MVCLINKTFFFNLFAILDSYLTTSQTIENLPELDLEAHYIDSVTSNDPEVQKVLFEKIFFQINHFPFQLLRMLPDASYRLKWTYGVEAFQQWCAQRNRPILTAAPEGNCNSFCFFNKNFFQKPKSPNNISLNLIYFPTSMVMNYNKLWMSLYVKFVVQQANNIYQKVYITFVWVRVLPNEILK
jgi:hypothetical protein